MIIREQRRIDRVQDGSGEERGDNGINESRWYDKPGGRIDNEGRKQGKKRPKGIAVLD